jgi:ABC-type Fe3+/spermidine/putrescine transport system ATPase subunit
MLHLNHIHRTVAGFSLNDITFSVDEGEYFVLLGESGAGKSMILELVAGLDLPNSGTITLSGMDITRLSIRERQVGLVFQDLALFPHLTVYENLAFPLHQHHSKKKSKPEITAMAEMLGITPLLSRRPGTLSGGEMQRVALGRCLILQPKILLLDEPLSSLDSARKTSLRRLLRTVHRRGQTIVHVTHDYEEALALGTRIAVVHQGAIVQVGTPETVFGNPVNAFMAAFTGIRNFFHARLKIMNNATFAVIGEKIEIPIKGHFAETEIRLMIRADEVNISLAPVLEKGITCFPGLIAEIIPCRTGLDLVVDIGIEIHTQTSSEVIQALNLQTGSACWVAFCDETVKIVSSTNDDHL